MKFQLLLTLSFLCSESCWITINCTPFYHITFYFIPSTHKFPRFFILFLYTQAHKETFVNFFSLLTFKMTLTIIFQTEKLTVFPFLYFFSSAIIIAFIQEMCEDLSHKCGAKFQKFILFIIVIIYFYFFPFFQKVKFVTEQLFGQRLFLKNSFSQRHILMKI